MSPSSALAGEADGEDGDAHEPRAPERAGQAQAHEAARIGGALGLALEPDALPAAGALVPFYVLLWPTADDRLPQLLVQSATTSSTASWMKV